MGLVERVTIDCGASLHLSGYFPGDDLLGLLDAHSDHVAVLIQDRFELLEPRAPFLEAGERADLGTYPMPNSHAAIIGHRASELNGPFLSKRRPSASAGDLQTVPLPAESASARRQNRYRG